MTDLLATTAPVFKVEGSVRGELARDLSRLEIDEATDGMKTLVLRLVARGPVADAPEQQQLYLDGKIVDFGKRLEVALGQGASARIVFAGAISAIEALFAEGDEPHVVIYAEDRLMDLRMTRRMKTWEDMSDAGIAAAIAALHGLAADATAPGPTYEVVQQWNQSDLAFLRERARLIQAELWLDDDVLKFKSRSERGGTAIRLVQGPDLIDVQLRADLAHQRTRVEASGYDADARAAIAQAAGADAIAGEIAGGRSGPAVLQQAFGERASYRVRASPLAADEASAWARAEMLRRSRGFVTVIGTTDGTPDMVVGSTLTLVAVGAPFDGDGYYVVRVCHTYDLTHGHRTHFEAQRASLNEA